MITRLLKALLNRSTASDESLDATTAVLDANYFLHYNAIREIDWLRHLTTTSVTLVLIPSVLRELNQTKDRDRSSKYRKRARRAMSDIKSILGESTQAPVSESITLRCEADDALIDFQQFRLTLYEADDWHIASCIQLSQRGHPNVVLVTGDYPLTLRAKAKGINTLYLPETLRLPDELTDEEKELRTLQKVAGRLPKLAVVFPSGLDRIEAAIASIPPIDQSEVEVLVDSVKTHHPLRPIEHGRGFMSREFEKYNSKLQEYYAALEKYMHRRHDHARMMGRTIELPLFLVNRGTAAGNDIDITIEAELDVEVLVFEKGSKWLSAPSEPKPPRTPEDALVPEGLGMASWMSIIPDQLHIERDRYFALESEHPGHPVQERCFEVAAGINKLKQDRQWEMGTILVSFPEASSPRSFSINYSINCDELPQNTDGTLHVIVKSQSNESCLNLPRSDEPITNGTETVPICSNLGINAWSAN